MKNKKNTELNFLYLDDKYNSNKKIPTKKAKKNSTKKKAKSNTEENDVFNFDNEIVIGVTTLPKEKDKNNISKNNSSKKKNVKKEKGADKKSAPRNIQKKQAKNRLEKKKGSFTKQIIKWTILLSALIVSIIFFMMSPLFNISEINISGNNSISEETILSLSKIQIGDNIYKTSKKNIKQNIKQNAYIESVEVKRVLPNQIKLMVKERNTTYMLEYSNSFIYINNQGYILEITNQKLDVPLISGITTNQEQIQVGYRLNQEDLTRLEMILRITDSLEANGVTNKIDRIDISNKQNYTLYMEEENKIIYLGDASNLSSRMLYLKAALEDTKGLEGEIFINGDLVKEKAFFRQKE